jgi:hypothetical protein
MFCVRLRCEEKRLRDCKGFILLKLLRKIELLLGFLRSFLLKGMFSCLPRGENERCP